MIYNEEDGSVIVVGTISNQTSGQTFKNAIGIAKFASFGQVDTNWGISHTGKAVHNFRDQQYSSTYLDALGAGLAENPITHELFVAGTTEIATDNTTGKQHANLLVKLHNDLIFANNFDF